MFGVSSVCAQEQKYTTHIEGGILTYGPLTKELGYSFRGVNARRFTGNFSTGLGIGYEKYMLNENDGGKFKALPIFVQAKYVFSPLKSKSFYTAFDLGYSTSLNNSEENTFEKKSYKGGMLASPQIGIVWNTKHRQEFFTFSLGYKYQGFKEKRYYNFMWPNRTPMAVETGDARLNGYDNFTNSRYHLHRLSVMLGFGF